MRMIRLFILSIIWILLNKIHSTKYFKKCNNFNFQFKLERDKFLGKWYPIRMSKNFSIINKPECSTLIFSAFTDKTMNVEIGSRIEGATEEIYMFTQVAGYSNSFTSNSFKRSLLTILDTDNDYKEYAIAYICFDTFLFPNQYYAAILGRNPKMHKELITNLESKLKEKTNLSNLKSVNQECKI